MPASGKAGSFNLAKILYPLVKTPVAFAVEKVNNQFISSINPTKVYE